MASKRALASLAQACSTRTVSSPQLRALASATTGFNAVRTQWRSSRTFITRANRPALAVPAQPWCAPARRAAYSSDPLPGEEKLSKIWKFEDIQKLIESPSSKVTIIDSREPSELKETGRIPGAINVPVKSAPDSFFLSDDEFEDNYGFPRPSKDSEVVFYCKAGVRSRAAAELAKSAGWKKVGEYPGSWLEWFEKGGKIER